MTPTRRTPSSLRSDRGACVCVTCVSAAPPLHRPSRICTQLTGWGPSGRRGRKEEQDPRPLGSAQGGGGALASRPLPSPYKPWPAPAPAQPVPERADRVLCVLSATRLLCQLQSSRPGHGGAPGPDHVATAPREPTYPFLRPGHGRPRRLLVCGAARGTQGPARSGRPRSAGAGFRAQDNEDASGAYGAL